MTDVTGAFEDALRSSRYVRRILADEQSPAPASERAFPGLEADTGRNVLKRRRVVVPKDDFTKEAYRINGHVRQLRRFLAAIRGPFLDVSRRLAGSLDARPVTVTFPAIHSGTGPAPAPKSVVVTSLSDREKDEMEIELKKYTKICAGQVQNLRKYIDRLPESFQGSLLSTMTEPASARANRALLKEHRMGVLWYLDQQLMEASTQLRTMMEQRGVLEMKKRDMLRPKVLPPMALNNFEQLRGGPPAAETTSGSKIPLLGATPTFSLTRLAASAFGRTGRPASRSRERDADRSVDRARSGSRDTRAGPVAMNTSPPGSFINDESAENISGPAFGPLVTAGSSLESLISEHREKEVDIEGMLTPAQKMELEQENESLLKELEDNLEQVFQATQSIQEISQLQSQLAFHLQAQTETIERLHEEAIQQVDTVKSANDQLRSAQKRFGGRRTFILLFLMVMTVALLWLDYFYS